MLDKGFNISKIVAKQEYVCIIDVSGNEKVISRKEALYRANAVMGIDKDSQELVDHLLCAADTAMRYAQEKDGVSATGYNSKALDMIRAAAKDEAAKRL